MADLTMFASATLALVGAVCLGLFLVLAASARRLGDRRLWFIAGGFGVFFAKNALILVLLNQHAIGHSTTEVLDAVLDLAAVLLMATPFLVRGE